MITGVHTIVFTPEADTVRAFFRDALELPFVDAGAGWLIFALPPAELAVHPAERPSHELYLLCDDLDATVATLEAGGCSMTGPATARDWGRVTAISLPGGAGLGLYEPTHLRPGGVAAPSAAAAAARPVVAFADPASAALDHLLRLIAVEADVLSAAIVVVDPAGGLPIVAAFGLDAAAASGLAGAIARPGHPIARTASDAVATFDVRPDNPGGPTLRSHVPLAVARDGSTEAPIAGTDGCERVDAVSRALGVGVLALAHDRPMTEGTRRFVLASADLAALTVDHHRR